MLGYLLRRILAAIPVMGVVALFVFLLLRLTPGDPAAILAGDNATPEQLERIRTSLGLNEPLYAQFFTWIGKLLHGDLGVSLISNVPVLKMISQRVEPSISIAVSTIILAIVVFLMVRQINKLRRQSPAAPAAPPEEVKLLREIRDALVRK